MRHHAVFDGVGLNLTAASLHFIQVWILIGVQHTQYFSLDVIVKMLQVALKNR